jgi:hypothetical protein
MASTTKKKEVVEQLRARGCRVSFKTRQMAIDCLENLTWFERFPWHDEQKQILDTFRDAPRNQAMEIVVQGIFGNGKTTLMLGLFFSLWWNQVCDVEDICMCAFNVCIKNELIRRLRDDAGIKKRPMIRTFDSLIYSIAKALECPDLDKPNYEGRRKFVETWARENDLSDPEIRARIALPEMTRVRWLFVDETQDLEGRFYELLRILFPRASMIFFGDVFQCIQKEPRTCLLWRVLRPLTESSGTTRYIFKMKKTPRVPPRILDEIRAALVTHYPEHTSLLAEWESLNTTAVEDKDCIQWSRFRSYQDVFQQSLHYIEEHGPTNVMILVFSSAITVRGGLGDVARFREFYQRQGIAVNSNYKRLEPDRLFLSTVNSSKGLERPYVFLILTFPLELAFANFSSDLCVNLVSVGLSRCKRQVVFSVPVYRDRHSRVLDLYKSAPHADSLESTFSVSREKGKKPSYATFLQDAESTDPPLPSQVNEYMALEKNVAVFLEKEHSTTEIIRQGIISYDTRLQCMEYTRYVPAESASLLPGLEAGGFPHASWRLQLMKELHREEERSLLGLLMEQLLTTIWTQEWPRDLAMPTDDQPMFQHCRKEYSTCLRQYFQGIHTVGILHASAGHRVRTLYLYARCFLMLHNKVSVSFRESTLVSLVVWASAALGPGRLQERISALVPPGKSFKVQHRMQMPCMTGIADAFCETSAAAVEGATEGGGGGGVSRKNVTVVEIKACLQSGWREEALFQAFLYFIMSNRTSGTIILLNPVRNEKVTYRVYIPRYYTVRTRLFQEILLWNTNCFLCKYDASSSSSHRDTPPFLLICRTLDPSGKTRGACVLRFQAATKMDVLLSGYSVTTNPTAPETPETPTIIKAPTSRSEKLTFQATVKEEDLEIQITRTLGFLDYPVLEVTIENKDNLGALDRPTRWSFHGKLSSSLQSFLDTHKDKTMRQYLAHMSYHNTEASEHSVTPDWEDHFVTAMSLTCLARPAV